MTPTLPVAVPRYQLAASALMRIASTYFNSYMAAPGNVDAYDTWRDLRGFGTLLLDRRALELSETERDGLALLLGGVIRNDDSEYLLSLSFDERA